MKIVTWNVEWRNAGSPAAAVIRERIFRHDPEIVCLTEAPANFLDAISGFTIESEADYGYRLQGNRRKVLLWSKTPWLRVDQVGNPDLPSGRFVGGRTSTSLGDLCAVGVCVPWAAAHVTTGRKDRERWQDHVQYLRGLESVLAGCEAGTVIAGDFNQCVPKRAAPLHVFYALEKAVLDRFDVATQGLVEPLGEFSIDHIAHSPDLFPVSVVGLSSVGARGERLSDHFGVVVDLHRGAAG